MAKLEIGPKNFLYPSMIEAAKRKAKTVTCQVKVILSGRSFAASLLTRFYTNKELAGKSISENTKGQVSLDHGIIT